MRGASPYTVLQVRYSNRDRECLRLDFVEGKHTETGAGKSKKLAKRQAANKMIKKLRELPVENEDAFHNMDDDELAQGELWNTLCKYNLCTQV